MNEGKIQISLEIDGKTGAATIKDVNKNLDEMFDKVEGKSKAATTGFDAITGSLTGMLPAITAASVAYAAYNFALSSIKASEDAERANLQVGSALKSVGALTVENKRYVMELGEQYSHMTPYLHDQIQSAESLAIRYGVSLDQLPKLIGLSSDLASVLGGDLTTNMRTLTLVQDGNEMALRMLNRTSKAFSEEQLNTIRVLHDTGRAAEGGAMALDILSKKFGGATLDNMTEYEKAAHEFKVSWDELKESVGAPLTASLLLILTGKVVLSQEDSDKMQQIKETMMGQAAHAKGEMTEAEKAAFAKVPQLNRYGKVIEKITGPSIDAELRRLQGEKEELEQDIKRMQSIFKTPGMKSPAESISGRADYFTIADMDVGPGRVTNYADVGGADVSDPTRTNKALRGNAWSMNIYDVSPKKHSQEVIDGWSAIGEAATQVFGVIDINANRSEKAWLGSLSAISSNMGSMIDQAGKLTSILEKGGPGAGVAALVPGFGLVTGIISTISGIINAASGQEDTASKDAKTQQDERLRQSTATFSRQRPVNAFYYITISNTGENIIIGPSGISEAGQAMVPVIISGLKRAAETGEIAQPREGA